MDYKNNCFNLLLERFGLYDIKRSVGVFLLDKPQREVGASVYEVEEEARRKYCLYLNDLNTSFDAKFEKIDYDNERITFLNNLNKMKNSKCETHFYGFTLTLNKKYHKDNPKFMHRIMSKYIEHHSKRLFNKKTRFWIYPEFTQNGVLHWHGLIVGEWQANISTFLTYYKRKFGYVKPEWDIRKKDIWIKYIIKDRNKTGLWCIQTNKLKK